MSFLYTKLCSFLPVDPVHPVVSLGRWRSLIEKFQDCQLISSKKIVGRLGCWPPSRQSTIGKPTCYGHEELGTNIFVQ